MTIRKKTSKLARPLPDLEKICVRKNGRRSSFLKNLKTTAHDVVIQGGRNIMDLKTHLDDYAAYYMVHAHPKTGTSKSAASYVSRIKRAYRIALKDPDVASLTGNKEIEELVHAMVVLDNKSRSLLLETMEALALKEFEKSRNRAYLDVVSSLRLYREYVSDLKEGKNRLKLKGRLLAKLKKMGFFSHDMLMRRFLARVNTWDRVASDWCLPFRIASAIFGDEPAYRQMIEEALDEMEFRTSSGILRLKDIRYIRINADGRVHAYANGKMHLIYNNGKTWRPMRAKSLADISIDHDPSLKKVAPSLIFSGECPELRRLSDDILAVIMASGNSAWLTKQQKSKIANYYLYGVETTGKKKPALVIRYWNAPGYDKAQLLEDIRKVFRATRLEAMETRSNSKKGA